jgi:dienelactone hydrolase
MPLEKVIVKECDNKLGELPIYVSVDGHKTAVIVLQEWWGVNGISNSIKYSLHFKLF